MVISKLQEIRKANSVSIEELAVKTLLTSRTIENMERGKGTTLNNAKRVAKALGVKLEEII